MFTFGCTIKQRENRMVLYYNYPTPKQIAIETDYPFLTDNQFNQNIIDTAKMYRLDEFTGIQLKKATYKLWYEIAKIDTDESRKEYYANMNPENDSSTFFLYGKINFQSGVNSLITLESDGGIGDEICGKTLWLFNIKDNKLCSIVIIGSFFNNNASPCPFVCVKNKVITKTRTEDNYFLRANFGDRFQLRDKVYFSTFTIDDNGFLKFTEN